MNWLEKEYKDRFDGASSLEGINENDMWDVISDALDEEQGTGNNDNKKKRRFVIFFMFLCCGVAGLILGLYNLETNEKEIITNVKIDEGINSSIHFWNKYKSLYNDEIIGNSVASRNAKLNSENKIGNQKIKEKINIKEVDSQLLVREYFNSSNRNFEESKEEYIDSGKNVVNTNPVIISNKKEDIIIDYDLQENKREEELISTNLDYPTLLELSKINYQLMNELDFYNKKKELKRNPIKSKFNYAIGVFSGANYVNNYYKENPNNIELNDKLKESHQAEVGFSSGIKLFIESPKNYFFATGVEYHSVQSEFNTIHFSKSQMLREGTNQYISAIAERTISHNNRYKFISIPFEVGVKTKFRKFDLGISAGIGLNYMVLQQGKTLDANDEILLIDNSSKSTIPFKKTFLSYQMNPFVSYHLNDQFSLRLAPTIRYQNHGKSEAYQLESSSVLSGLNIGVLMSI